MGWFNKISKALEEYHLPRDFDSIRTMPVARWVRLVTEAVEIKKPITHKSRPTQNRQWNRNTQNKDKNNI